jgi:hypothetical protein
VLIISTLVKISLDNFDKLNEKETLVLQATKRAIPKLHDKSTEELSEYLQEMDEDQLLGLANNVKGILHEIQFVEIENSDGDEFTASLFTDTNHPDTDVILTNNITGEISEVQLKATDSSSYVNDWINNHEDGEILVTEEIAEKMGLQSSGQLNSELTVDVNEFVEKLIELDDDSNLWDYIPTLPAISIAIASFHLFRLYKDDKISFQTLKVKFALLTGKKIAKFSIIAGLMMIPIVNVIVGAGLLFNLLYGVGTLANKYVPQSSRLPH